VYVETFALLPAKIEFDRHLCLFVSYFLSWTHEGVMQDIYWKSRKKLKSCNKSERSGLIPMKSVTYPNDSYHF
jgi:hypothetical protein